MAQEVGRHGTRGQGRTASFPRPRADSSQQVLGEQSQEEIALMNHLTVALSISLLTSTLAALQATPDSMKDCPMHRQHTDPSHEAIVKRHGDQAMVFPHDRTTHHFRMAPDGGSIEVTVRDAKDQTNTDAIRSHL